MRTVDSQPLCLRPGLALCFGGREQSAIILGMAAGNLVKFARTLQLLQGVEARSVEQTILSDLAARVGGDQRFADKVRDVVDNVWQTSIGDDGNRSLKREIADEHA